ncbi:tyrosine-type recombinase/integrase [Candidatus Roizmanbacteria bacterium]|nr:tyrosine-type recombinase/integrase [Candidatus Roizmanbacteria bacterium]
MESSLFPSLIEKFIDFLKTQGKSNFTIIAYKKDLEQFVGFLSAKDTADIRDVKKAEIEQFLNKLLTENYTKKSASRKLNSIRTFFRFLKNEGVIEVNPALDVPHPKYAQMPPRVLSKLEYRAIRDVAKEDARTYAIVEVLLQTGIRIGELTNIRLSDVKDDQLYVRPYGKNQGREVPLNKPVKKAVSDYLRVRGNSEKKEDDFLFITRTGKPLLIRNVRQLITRCFREVGIENATVNDFRNTFIAHQLTSGYSIEHIAKVVGHRRLSSTERFLDIVKEAPEKKEKLEEL